MKQRPILFSTEMILAITEGRKFQTRRTVKNLTDCTEKHKIYDASWKDEPMKMTCSDDGYWYCEFCGNGVNFNNDFSGIKCPYGQVGDILWVREAFCLRPPTMLDAIDSPHYVYRAATELDLWSTYKWKPSIFMPKDACRFWLRITNIRIEKAQDISEEDALKEGVRFYEDEVLKSKHFKDYMEDASGYGHPHHDYPSVNTAKESFQTLWESINGKESWESNPLVWVVEFSIIKDGNI